MPRELDEMVAAIKRRGGKKVHNPFAVARARLGADAEIKARRKKERKE